MVDPSHSRVDGFRVTLWFRGGEIPPGFLEKLAESPRKVFKNYQSPGFIPGLLNLWGWPYVLVSSKNSPGGINKARIEKALVLLLEGWLENASGRDSWFRGERVW